MDVIRGISKLDKRPDNPVMAIGVFDGVHRGHQHLIKKAIARARDVGGTSVVMTFDPHPACVLRPESGFRYIGTLPYRLRLLEELGVDMVIVIEFTKEFSRTSPRDFVTRYIHQEVGSKDIFVGENFRFGQNRSGDLGLFQSIGNELGMAVNIVQSISGDGEVISSSRLRRLIAEGDLDAAGRLLGRPVALLGDVVKGDGRGKKLNFPTANLVCRDMVIPPQGVYAVRVHVRGHVYNGMANIGTRPSFDAGHDLVLETHIFDFEDDIYGESILVEYHRRLRSEQKFASADALKAQLLKDKMAAENILTAS